MKNVKNIKVKVTRTVDWEMLQGLFVTSCEGGSNYWCKEVKPLGKSKDGYEAMLDGFIVTDMTEAKDKKHKVTWIKIKKACQLFADGYPDRFTQSIGGYSDSEDGDIFLQLCVFGKVLYG